MGDTASTATATEHGHLGKSLRWYDGAILAMAAPANLFVALGFTIGAIGAWAAVLVWTISTAVALLQNRFFAEMASMFPNQSGGIAMYAHEAWRKYFSPVGPIAAAGYWIGWTVVLAILATLIGSIVVETWFPSSDWVLFHGPVDVGLAHLIAVGVIVGVWLISILGIRVAVWVTHVTGAIFAVIILTVIAGTFISGSFSADGLTYRLDGADGGGLKVALVWLFLIGWGSYATEVCASFAPEYRDTQRDTTKALRVAGIYTLIIFAIAPVSSAGTVGEQAIADQPQTYPIAVMQAVFGQSMTDVAVGAVIAALLLVMVSAMADSSRALYGMAQQGTTVRQLDHINRHGVPGRAMTVNLVVNLALVLLVGSTVGILFASNLGYMTAVILALAAFLLLRRDRPNWPRPFRNGRAWIPVAALLVVFNTVVTVVGATNPGLSGYDGQAGVLIGLGVLTLAVVLFVYRRVVQDRAGIGLREATPSRPVPEAADGAVPLAPEPVSSSA